MVVTIEPLATQRDEQGAGLEAARVGRHAREAHAAVALQRRLRQRTRQFGHRHHAAGSRLPRSASAALARSTSENGVRTPRDS